MSRETARHGFNEDAATRILLRSPPSAAALAWAASAAGAPIAAWSVLRGGMSSAMYLLELNNATATRLVLRCYVRPDVNEEEPDLAQREVAALTVTTRIAIATPEVVAVDTTGDAVGVPAVLMTWLPGRVVWDPKGVRQWLSRLAALLPIVHDADADRTDRPLGLYFNYQQQSYEPPKWATKPAVWDQAAEVFHGPVLESERCFIHRDFHPGNVLWQRGRVTGVVDWQSACIGPPSVDVGHCRANFLGYAPELADWFAGITEEITGRAFHPWADIAGLIGMLDGLRTHPPRAAGRPAIEATLERALTELL